MQAITVGLLKNRLSHLLSHEEPNGLYYYNPLICNGWVGFHTGAWQQNWRR